MGELLDAFGEEKALVIAAFFLSFSGERDGDDGVYSFLHAIPYPCSERFNKGANHLRQTGA